MNPDKQRIAIAEACGWINQGRAKGVKALEHRWRNPETKQIQDGCPDYLNDLNAMAEAEKILSADQQEDYAEHVFMVMTHGGRDAYNYPTCLLFPTATQRAEAFLKTKGLWEPDAV